MKKYLFLSIFILVSCKDKSSVIENDLKDAFLDSCAQNSDIKYCECMYESLGVNPEGFLDVLDNFDEDFLAKAFNYCKED